VFWGLYRALSNASSDGALTGGFYWLPDLAGPTSLAAQKAGARPPSGLGLPGRSTFCALPSRRRREARPGLRCMASPPRSLTPTGQHPTLTRRAGAGASWLYPLVDGAPPIGWEAAARYLVLPALLVGAQYASSAIISPPVNPDDEGSAKTTKARARPGAPRAGRWGVRGCLRISLSGLLVGYAAWVGCGLLLHACEPVLSPCEDVFHGVRMYHIGGAANRPVGSVCGHGAQHKRGGECCAAGL